MLFDQEDGKSVEEIIEIVLQRRPSLRSRIEEIVLASGLSLEEIVNECLGKGLRQMKDPAKRAAFYAKLHWREAPYGFDPLLRRNS